MSFSPFVNEDTPVKVTYQDVTYQKAGYVDLTPFAL